MTEIPPAWKQSAEEAIKLIFRGVNEVSVIQENDAKLTDQEFIIPLC